MSDRKGDPAKQPPECKPVFTPHPEPKPPGAVGQGTWSQCPNLQCTYESMDGERWGCEVCGESYYLDYEEMR
jgi:hypothetical protein